MEMDGGNQMETIDFVILWVDGNDPEWRKQKALYSSTVDHGNEERKFREWDQLKYWFRGVEKYAPWVNKIHFVTCGHVPDWLNLNHPKLHFVKHEDFIPSEYLPTFSSNPIELNIHRIDGLSDKFVYFNDDMFIINRVSPDDFFSNGIPRSTAGLAVTGHVPTEFAGILHTARSFVNNNFNSLEVIRKHFWKFINPRYGMKRNLLTALLLPYCREFFPGFYVAHGANAYLKETFVEIWKKGREELHETCTHKFRTPFDLSQFAFLWWQWCKGLVVPQDFRKLATFLSVASPPPKITHTIENQATPIIIINDTWVEDFKKTKAEINGAFDIILGEKSSFEL